MWFLFGLVLGLVLGFVAYFEVIYKMKQNNFITINKKRKGENVQ